MLDTVTVKPLLTCRKSNSSYLRTLTFLGQRSGGQAIPQGLNMEDRGRYKHRQVLGQVVSSYVQVLSDLSLKTETQDVGVSLTKRPHNVKGTAQILGDSNIHTHTHTHTRARTHTHTHTLTHIHTRTHYPHTHTQETSPAEAPHPAGKHSTDRDTITYTRSLSLSLSFYHTHTKTCQRVQAPSSDVTYT